MNVVCSVLCLFVVFAPALLAQNNYYCRGYGGIFAGNLRIGEPAQTLVADLPNSYGNTDIRIMFRRPAFDSMPKCSIAKRPCLVFVHGGGWVANGSLDAWKFMSDSLSQFFVPDGFITASVKYRLGIGGGNEVLFLSNNGCLINPLSDVTNAVGRAAHDVQLAVQHIRRNADSLGIDTANIFLFGVSAGAYNVINAAYLETGDKLYNWTMPERARVKGVIGFAGAVVDTAILSAADPKVPLFFLHGTCDRVVPFSSGRVLQCADIAPFKFNVHGSEAMYRRAQTLGIPAQLHAVCGADHDAGTTDISTVFYSICRIRNWLASLLFGEIPATTSEYRSLRDATCGAPACSPILCRDSVERFFLLSVPPVPAVSAQTITISPQPAGSVIQVMNPNTEAIAYTLVSMLGIPLTDGTLASGLNSIDVSMLPQGRYLLRVMQNQSQYVQCVSIVR